MTLIELKNNFKSTLDSMYPTEEIDSFFYLLMDAQLNLKRVDIALNPTQIISTSDVTFFTDALKKLQQEIPIQYIIGTTEFFGLPFYVNKNVLIPRPETEELVQWILDTNQPTTDNQQLNILDIGTGSGCIAISLAKNISNAKVYALDVSEKALAIAKKNAELNKVNVEFIQQDILNVIANKVKQSHDDKEITLSQTPRNDELKFDIIVSNPPYVRELEKKEINNNVLNNEPHLALFVDDNNPLIFYKKIANFAKENLSNHGQLFLEINQYLGKETVELLNHKDFKNTTLQKDIFGNDRMIKASI